MGAVRNQQTLDILVSSLSENGGDRHLACRRAGVSHAFVVAWCRSDSQVEEAIKQAIDAGTSVLESAAIRRAVKGVKEPIMHNGDIVAYKRKYSDGLLETMLKARNPAVYGTKIDVNKTVTIKTLSDAELDERITALSERLGITYQPSDAEDAEFEEVIELEDLL